MKKDLVIEKRYTSKITKNVNSALNENELRLIAEKTEMELLEKAESIVRGDDVDGDDEVFTEWL